MSEDLALSAQAKLVDSNASASVSQFLRSSIQLIKVSNQMETPNSEVHVWTWALHLGILSGELHEQHIRFTQKLVALLKMGAPTKGAAETQEAHELNLKNYAMEVSSLEGLLARIKGCSHVIKDLAAWAELFKCGTAEEQKDASVLLSVHSLLVCKNCKKHTKRKRIRNKALVKRKNSKNKGQQEQGVPPRKPLSSLRTS